jgi:hypothetical protein
MEPVTINVSAETGGNFVVSLPLYTPPPRYDGVPWSEVIVQEGATNEGPWTTLATDDIPEGNLDVDPSQPRVLGITIIGATLENGWYLVTFADDDGGRRPTNPYSMGDSHLPPAPALEEVAALMRAHVADADDNQLQTFTEDTNPPADTVRIIIETVRQEVATRLRATIPGRYADSARFVVAIGTVAYIDPSARPEGQAQSTARTVFLARLSDLQEACNEAYFRRLA